MEKKKKQGNIIYTVGKDKFGKYYASVEVEKLQGGYCATTTKFFCEKDNINDFLEELARTVYSEALVMACEMFFLDAMVELSDNLFVIGNLFANSARYFKTLCDKVAVLTSN